MRIRELGLVPYEETVASMREFTKGRDGDTDDELWLLQHPAVFTQGIAGKPEHLLRETAIPTVQTDRGGQVTYHGPGQLVIYTLINIKRAGLGVRVLSQPLSSRLLRRSHNGTSIQLLSLKRRVSMCRVRRSHHSV